ncbi:hypothetical protein CLF_102180 [Clonorchis sinensis]|uniref:Uncharacterized protein n=1 Tax=Clonorchis sinensis TaxID=79923 RepID=G7Y7F5_CLOSI|nr:hypothetical protein CLF_102180 [Clonorchis sinensis]
MSRRGLRSTSQRLMAEAVEIAKHPSVYRIEGVELECGVRFWISRADMSCAGMFEYERKANIGRIGLVSLSTSVRQFITVYADADKTNVCVVVTSKSNFTTNWSECNGSERDSLKSSSLHAGLMIPSTDESVNAGPPHTSTINVLRTTRRFRRVQHPFHEGISPATTPSSATKPCNIKEDHLSEGLAFFNHGWKDGDIDQVVEDYAKVLRTTRRFRRVQHPFHEGISPATTPSSATKPCNIKEDHLSEGLAFFNHGWKDGDIDQVVEDYAKVSDV